MTKRFVEGLIIFVVVFISIAPAVVAIPIDLTKDEEEILSKIRTLWAESQRVKARLKELDSSIQKIRAMETHDHRGFNGLAMDRLERSLADRQECTKRLIALREERRRLEEIRKEANRIKLVLLGHAP